MHQVLRGYRVLEVASWVMVPVAGAVLAEWGADVLKIEHPELGDPLRGLVVRGLGDGEDAVNVQWEHANRGKRGLAIDLSTEDGRQIVLGLAETADVFITNMLPHVRDQLRIDVDDLRAVNPSIIVARGSAFGPKGPEAGRGSFDMAAFWARSGCCDSADDRSGAYPPSMPLGVHGDTISGLSLAGGITAALLHRERTGEALTVDLSLLGMGTWASSVTVEMASAFGLERAPHLPRENPFNPLVNMYRTSDGRCLSLAMLRSDPFWRQLMDAAERPDLVDDERFVDARSRGENSQACVQALDGVFATKTLAEWSDLLEGLEAQWSPVQTAREIASDRQVLANHHLVEVESAGGGSFKLVPVPLRFDEHEPSLRRAPLFGEHNDEVLIDSGLDTEQVLELKIKGVVL
jgi:crotonobetainyl-CoA:carnitine CoA-transferase CaiB-like acyl-CoA transferase